jgi:hypothetical protein
VTPPIAQGIARLELGEARAAGVLCRENICNEKNSRNSIGNSWLAKASLCKRTNLVNLIESGRRYWIVPGFEIFQLHRQLIGFSNDCGRTVMNKTKIYLHEWDKKKLWRTMRNNVRAYGGRATAK